MRTTVHEYGGGEYIAGEGAVYFSNFKCDWLLGLEAICVQRGASLQCAVYVCAASNIHSPSTNATPR